MALKWNLRSVLTRTNQLVWENIALKILAIAFALGFYAFVHSTEDAQRTLPVDVVATPPPASARRVLITPLPSVVRVTVRGPRTLLDEMKAEDLGTFPLDLRSGKVEHIDFDPSAVQVRPGVRAEQIDPPSITLRWEDEVIREIPVQASIVGQPTAGLVVQGAARCEPATIRAIGPKSVVDVVQFARAEPFDVTGINKEGEVDRHLALERPPSRVEFERQTVNAKITLAREEITRTFIKVPVQLVGVARGVVAPTEVDVRVHGPTELVQALRPEQIVPTVDLRTSALNTGQPGSAKMPVIVELAGCEAAVQPQVVVVRW